MNAVSRRLRAGAIAIAAVAALGAPASAQALDFVSVSAQPADTQAGANTDFTISIEFASASDDVKDLVIGLPPGLVGNPTAAPQCSVEDLNADACDPASDVGDVNTNASVLSLPLPIDIPGDLYNLTPQQGEPARFGIVLRPAGGILPKVVMQSGAELRESDFGLNTVINDIPNTSSGLPIDINSMTVSLAGLAGDPPAGFIRNPTSCVPAAATFSATSYADPDNPVTAEAPGFTPTGCETLPFTPELSARIGAPGKTIAGTRPPLTTVISQTIDEAGLSRARVILPSNMGSDLAVLEQSCPAAQFEAGACPAATVVGTAVAASPLLSEPLTGPVVLVSPPAPGLPLVGLDLTGPMALKVFGEFVIGSGTGLEFEGLPDIPIADFALTFSADKLVVNPQPLCDGEARVFSTDFLGHNGATSTGSVAAVLEGCVPGNDGGVAGKKKCKRSKKKKAKKRDAGAAKKKKAKRKKCKRKKKKKKKKKRR